MSVIENNEPSRDPPKGRKIALAKPQAVQATNPMTVVERAIEKGITGQDLKELMDLQERWEAGQARKAFDLAMANAQADMPKIVKSRLVEYGEGTKKTTYKHEDLAEVLAQITPVLKVHGLAVRFRTEQVDGGQVRVFCLLTGHGHREENSLQSSRDSSGGKNDIQAIGSVITYLERYTLKAALGLASARDDDAGMAGGQNDDGSVITPAQLGELERLVKEVNANVAAACKALKIESLAELPAARFVKAKAKLESMRAPL